MPTQMQTFKYRSMTPALKRSAAQPHLPFAINKAAGGLTIGRRAVVNEWVSSGDEVHTAIVQTTPFLIFCLLRCIEQHHQEWCRLAAASDFAMSDLVTSMPATGNSGGLQFMTKQGVLYPEEWEAGMRLDGIPGSRTPVPRVEMPASRD
jgi:hypothetical protein